MPSRTKNCHYVQQSYLKLFSSNKNQSKIWQFDKTTAEIKERSIRNVAKSNYFYNEQVEKWLSKNVELWGIKAIRKLTRFKDVKRLTLDEKMKIVRWIIIQNERTLLRRIDHENSFNQFIQVLKKKGHLPEGEENLNPDSEAMQYSIMDKMLELAPILVNYHWLLLINNTSNKFYTSDHAIGTENTFYSLVQKKWGYNLYSGGIGYLSDGVELFFPLNPDIAMILINPRIPTLPIRISNLVSNAQFQALIRIWKGKTINRNEINATIDDISYHNSRLIFEASQYIFSQNDDFDLANKIIIDFPESRDINRSRMQIS